MKKRILSLALALTLCLGLSVPALAAGGGTSGYLDSGSASIPKLSKAEIAQLLEDNPLTLPEQVFDEVPSCTAPYAAGKVKTEALQAAADRLNALRRIAGLPAVQLDLELSEQVQYGAVIQGALGSLSHYPSQPAGMDDAFYQLARDASSSSNLYAGPSLTQAIDGFMDDSDASNIDRVGHRRWQLNPAMGKVGFGYAESSTMYRGYVSEYAFDRSGTCRDYDFVAWPASGNFPNNLSGFEQNTAWSVSLNPSEYSTPRQSDLTVTLTRESDGQTWTFQGSNYTAASSGVYFHVDTGGYGIANCIIFRPDGISSYEGVYTVTIDGLKSAGGSPVDFSYQVDFFDPANLDAEPEEPQEPEQPTDPGAPGDNQSGIMTSPNTTFASGLAIKEDGTLWGWGDGLSAWGKTWDGSTPVQLGSGYTAVWGSVEEAYLLKEDGTLWFRGSYLPYYGYLDETSTDPVQILDNVVQFCSGTALKADGSVWSILPPSEDAYDPDVLFYHIMDDAKQVSGGLYGGEFGMALKDDGTLWSWSNNPSGNSAIGWPAGDASFAPLTQILDGMAYVSGTMAIRTDGSLWSWGSNYFGAVGDGSGQDRYTPVKVLDHVVGAWCYSDAQMTTKYAMTEDGTLYSWGFGALGYAGGDTLYEASPSLGISDFYYQSVPRSVDITDVAAVCVGRNAVYVLKEDGSLWGTGSTYQGQLMRPDNNEEVTSFVRLMDGVMLPQGSQSEPGDNTASFSDVPASFWGHTYIIKASQANLMSGVGSGRFDPNGSLTLAQAAVLAYQIHSQANGGTLSDAAGAWYMPYYQYCLDNGIFTASQFAAADMDRQATRFDMVSILDQAVPASRMTAVKTVSDGSIPDLRESDPYGDVVYRWYRAGVVSGDGEGRFNGSTGITRAEVAVILCQLNNLV